MKWNWTAEEKKMGHAGCSRPGFAVFFKGTTFVFHLSFSPFLQLFWTQSALCPPLSTGHQHVNMEPRTVSEQMGRRIVHWLQPSHRESDSLLSSFLRENYSNANRANCSRRLRLGIVFFSLLWRFTSYFYHCQLAQIFIFHPSLIYLISWLLVPHVKKKTEL